MFGRAKNKPAEGNLIADLDEIVQGKSRIRLHGKDHTVNPVTVEEFFALSVALAEIQRIADAEKNTLSELMGGYYSLVHPVVPTITREDLEKCSYAQISMLVQHVMNHVTGGLTEEKKKELLRAMYPRGVK